jgi:quercetin dioxygenase-like cupin family protein
MRTIGFSALLLLGVALAPVAAPTAQGAAAEAPAGPAAQAVELTAEPSHHLALENEYVRVFKFEVGPHTATLLHRHGHDYVFVTLGEAHFANEIQGKPPVDMQLADGKTGFTAGGFAHVAKNLWDRPLRNVTIELLQDAKLHDAPSPWTEGEANREFPGVRIKELFLHDGARVSEVELQPGATVPSHHHDGPHLVVAVSDLDLRSEVEGKGTVNTQLKAGDVKWTPGGFTHTLTNTGRSPARLVTVEFKPDAGQP